jgi:hypothetical protein
MAKYSLFSIAPDRATADRLLHELKEADLPHLGISVLFLDRHPATANGPPSSSEIRGVVAWLEGVRTVTIPGVGSAIVAGPVAAYLGPDMVGGLARGLTDFGIPDQEAERYAGRIHQGEYFIGVRTETSDVTSRARDLFSSSGAEDTFTMMEVTARSTPDHSRPALRTSTA